MIDVKDLKLQLTKTYLVSFQVGYLIYIKYNTYFDNKIK